MPLRPSLLLPMATLVLAAAPPDLMGTATARAEVKRLFAQQKAIAGSRKALFGVFDQKLTGEEREALTFLVAGSPLCDLADMDGAYLLKEVQATFEARHTAAWGDRIPSDVFRHFVLPIRVNNEPLDAFRSTHFRELLARVKGMDMVRAAREINHWCQERVTYQGTDARTSNPMATLCTTFGRCGEESTLAVAALRAACIPARQVYTPRWAHCDDNHAWVEVWVDGKWRFLGACEPEPDLDMGWFKEPSRRAMLVHARTFGPYHGSEPVIVTAPRYSELNLTAHYAPVKPLTVTVQDRKGRPVPGATVDLRLYNYAEFYPLVSRTTDRGGRTRLELGLGDILVWARKGQAFGFRKVRLDREDQVTVTLDGDAHRAWTLDLDQVPPVERPALPANPAAREENERRLKAGQAHRKAITDTFPDAARAARLVQEAGLPADAAPYLVQATGNWKAILDFLTTTPAGQRPWALRLLGQLSAKDLRDTPAALLTHHLEGALAAAPRLAQEAPDTFAAYVLNPRVDVEILKPWRQSLPALLGPGVRSAAQVSQWLETRVKVDDALNPWRLPVPSAGVLDLKVSDTRSRAIAFVAACRSLGLPARLHPELRQPQYLDAGTWKDASFVPRTVAMPQGQVTLKAPASPVLKVGTHVSLARFQEGAYQTLDLPEDQPLASLKMPLSLPAGSYLAITGNRLADGTVLTRLQFFPLKAEASVEVPLALRATAEAAPTLGQLPLASLPAGTACTTPGSRILAWVGPGQEPTRHVMGDLRTLKLELEKTGAPLVLLTPAGSDAHPDFQGLPATVVRTQDADLALLKAASQATGRPLGQRLPVLLVVDPQGRIRFLNEGYRIGLGEQIIKTLATLH